jgi:thiamine-monophosphate kinase
LGFGIPPADRASPGNIVDKEQTIIDRIRRALLAHPSRTGSYRLKLGIGDDAAILHAPANRDWAVSCDSFIEGAHFLVDRHPAESVGYKALARATSDLAAMGATPRFFFLSLAIPAARTGAWLTRFLNGLARASRKIDIVLAGGDTTEHSIVSINITVIGETRPGRAILRSGACPEDSIYVSGTLGEAQLGLELIRRKLDKNSQWEKLLGPHLYPQPRIELGQLLASRRLASSMIDISDGLSTDLARLCAASRVGARLLAGQIPRVAIPAALLERGLDPLQMALNGGDDYELLFTVPKRQEMKLRFAAPRLRGGVKLSRIGEITSGKRILLVDEDDREKPLKPGGWVHFRS